ncbi:adhesion G protein-coupled receptor E5-like [Sycon ciliatum]|uniref:adhesion G protein-coupled receptor E5-like n=1 Tax=Sycon ciliatum TaxID=27933 RepID=UPI0031F656B3
MLTAAEVRTLYENEILMRLFRGRNVQIDYFQYTLISSSVVDIKCDITAPADFISEISGNSSAVNLHGNFTAALETTIVGSLNLVPGSLQVFAYDVCSPETIDGGLRGLFDWSETFLNATETLPCPVSLDDGVVRFATRRCAIVPRMHNSMLDMAEWETTDITSCPTPNTAKLQQLAKVDFNTTAPDLVLNSSLEVARLTNDSAELTNDDIDFASTAIFNLVTAVSNDEIFNQSVGQEVAQATLKSVDNILNVKSNTTVVSSSPAKRIAKSLERLVTTLTVDVDQPFQKQEKNLGFAVSCPEENATTQAFRSISPLGDGTFYVGKANTSAAVAQEGVAFDIAGSTITAATERLGLSNSSVCAVAPTRYILYKTHTLFKDTNLSANTSLVSEIISAQAGDTALSNLQDPALMSFNFLESLYQGTSYVLSCVFWDFDKDDGNGGWSNQGCTSVFQNGTSANRTVCSCDHLTNFAVLFTRTAKIQQGIPDVSLKYVSIIGCGLSMLGLLGTMTIVAMLPKLRKNIHHRMMFGLSAVLLIFLAVFTIVLYHENLEKTAEACKSLAVLLHYLLICAFMWMSVDATFLYKQIVIVFDDTGDRQKRILFASIFVIPLVIVGISAGATTADAYGTGNVCWITSDSVFYGGLVAPMGLSILYNLAVLIAVVNALRKQRKRFSGGSHGGAKERKPMLVVIVSLSVLQGVTWVFGFLVLAHDHLVLQYVFTVLNSLQGFFIFIHTVRGHEAKKGLKDTLSFGNMSLPSMSSGSWVPRSRGIGKSRPPSDISLPEKLNTGKEAQLKPVLQRDNTYAQLKSKRQFLRETEQVSTSFLGTRGYSGADDELENIDLDMLEPASDKSILIAHESLPATSFVPMEDVSGNEGEPGTVDNNGCAQDEEQETEFQSMSAVELEVQLMGDIEDHTEPTEEESHADAERVAFLFDEPMTRAQVELSDYLERFIQDSLEY